MGLQMTPERVGKGEGGDTPNEGPKRASFPGGAERLAPRNSLDFSRWSCQFWSPKMRLPAPPHFNEFWIRILTKVTMLVPKTGTSWTHFFFRKKRTGRPVRAGASVHFGPSILNRFLEPFSGTKTRVRERGEADSKTLLI